jgi:hypothetical protein
MKHKISLPVMPNEKEFRTVYKSNELRQCIVLLVYLPRLTLSDIQSFPQWQRDSE